MTTFTEYNINSLPALFFLVIGYISDAPGWLKVTGIVVGILYYIYSAVLATIKEKREREKENKTIKKKK